MKSIKILGAMAAVLLAPAFSTMANSGIIKVTVAQDSPYRLTAKPAATASGVKFQVAAVKTQADTAAKDKASSTRAVRPHWR
jgi:hypothetical protein